MAKHLCLILFFALAAGATDFRLSGGFATAQGGRPFWCQTNCTAGQEILFDAATGTGGAYQVWSMKTDGTNVTNRSAAFTGQVSTKNQGNAMYSPDGAWIVMCNQSASSALAVGSFLAQPGQCMDANLVVCAVATNVCTRLTNITIDGTHGSLAPHFSRDGAKVLWGAMTQLNGAGDPAGVLEVCNWVPATPAINTCSNLADTTLAGWFEPSDTDPTHTPSCLVYYTGRGQGVNYNLYANFVWDFCAQPAKPTQLTNFGAWHEFVAQTTRGNVALSISTQFAPNPLVTSFPGPFELIMSDAKSGLNQYPLTCFNTPGSLDYDAAAGQVSVSHPTFDATGAHLAFTKVRATPADSFIWIYSFTNPSVAP